MGGRICLGDKYKIICLIKANINPLGSLEVVSSRSRSVCYNLTLITLNYFLSI